MVGQTFPIKMKFEGNSFSKTFHETEAWTENEFKTFLIDKDYEELKAGSVRLFEYDDDGFLIENKSFKYKFDDSVSGLIIKFSSLPITESDFNSYDVIIKTGIDAQAYGVETPVYSSSISAIPSVYDSIYGTCNYLDSDISSIECITRLVDANKIKLKVISADPLLGGNVVLKFKCGSTVWTQTISATTNEEYIDVVLPVTLSGILTIERLYLDSADTLSDNGFTISLIITGIIVENA